MHLHRLALKKPMHLLLLAGLLWSTTTGFLPNRGATPPGSPQLIIPAYTPIRYTTQSGDWLPAVARRFGVQPGEIVSPSPVNPIGVLPAGLLLLLPPLSTGLPAPLHLLPDSEVVYGPGAADFDIDAYIRGTNGYLRRYSQYLANAGAAPAGELIRRVAQANSINPRLLLGLLEYTCQCVLADPKGIHADDYLIGVKDYRFKGLYGQLNWIANQLSVGYYGWRLGSLREYRLPDGIITRPAPGDNAGTVALQSYFAALLTAQRDAAKYSAPGSLARQRMEQGLDFDHWRLALDPANGFLALYERMFGDYRGRAWFAGDLLPGGLSQPELALPFESGWVWSLTGGPHAAWQSDGPWAALDFAPATKYNGCEPNAAWATAAASGLVTRSGPGYVVQDLDGDGNEGTGWVLLYLHMHQDHLISAGTFLPAGAQIGHPSCEGGHATGSHLHIARKYNGEWILADGPVPFLLGGWTAHNGEKAYGGSLTGGDVTIIANPYGTGPTLLVREDAADDAAMSPELSLPAPEK